MRKANNEPHGEEAATAAVSNHEAAIRQMRFPCLGWRAELPAAGESPIMRRRSWSKRAFECDRPRPIRHRYPVPVKGKAVSAAAGASPSLPGERAVALALLVLAVPLALLLVERHQLFLHDDTFISLRYARNFIEGNGLVWNPGERVEGYTNFAHVMAVSALGYLGVDPIAAARAVNFAALALIPVVLGRFLFFGPGRGNPLAAAIATAMSFVSGPLVIWSLGGLEAPLLTLFVTGGVVATLTVLVEGPRVRPAVFGGICFALAVLTRPDAAIFLVASSLALAAGAWRRGVKALAAAAILPVAAFPPIALHEAWRLWYYGDWVPNTFYTKLAMVTDETVIHGLDYVWDYGKQPPFALALAAAAAIAALGSPRWRASALYLGGMILAFLAYLIRAGGDHMPGSRLMAPLIPMMALLLYMGLETHAGRFSPRGRAGLAALFLVLLGLQVFSGEARRRDPAALIGTVIGKYVATAWPAGSLIASNAAGALPYYAKNHRFIDMLGLNDRHIARREVTEIRRQWQLKPGHGKGDGAYVFARRPDYIILGPPQGTGTWNTFFLSDLELAENPLFLETYRPRAILIDISRVAEWRSYRVRNRKLRFIYYELKKD